MPSAGLCWTMTLRMCRATCTAWNRDYCWCRIDPIVGWALPVLDHHQTIDLTNGKKFNERWSREVIPSSRLPCMESFFWINSSAVVRSHICIAPFKCPESRNLLGIEPIRDDFSHSWTQKDVIIDPSIDLITHTRSPFDAKRTYNWSVSGITFCTNTCLSSCSPNGPKSFPAE